MAVGSMSICMDTRALNARHLCVHVCEGEARLLCRGEVDSSMVALCLLAQEAKGHKTGINYMEREGCVCVYMVGFEISSS